MKKRHHSFSQNAAIGRGRLNIGLLYPKVRNNIGVFLLTSPEPKYWTVCVPGIPGGVDASAFIFMEQKIMK